MVLEISLSVVRELAVYEVVVVIGAVEVVVAHLVKEAVVVLLHEPFCLFFVYYFYLLYTYVSVFSF